MTRQRTTHETMFFCRISGGQQCKLACIAQVGIRQFAKYGFGFVVDGSRCDDYDENSGLCISGKCQVSHVEMPFMCRSPIISTFFWKFWQITTRGSKLGQCIIERWRVLGRRKNRRIEENPLKQGHTRGAKQLKLTSSVPEFSLLLPSGNHVETLNATARQCTDFILVLVNINSTHKKR